MYTRVSCVSVSVQFFWGEDPDLHQILQGGHAFTVGVRVPDPENLTLLHVGCSRAPLPFCDSLIFLFVPGGCGIIPALKKLTRNEIKPQISLWEIVPRTSCTSHSKGLTPNTVPAFSVKEESRERPQGPELGKCTPRN